MSAKRNTRNSRSKSCGRLPTEVPQNAGPNSPTSDLRSSARLSRGRAALPSQQTNESVATVSISSIELPASYKDVDDPQGKKTLALTSTVIPKNNEINVVAEEGSKEGPRSAGEEGDNRGISATTANTHVATSGEIHRSVTPPPTPAALISTTDAVPKLGTPPSTSEDVVPKPVITQTIPEDNLEPPIPPSKPGDPWHTTFQELRAIRQRIKTLDNVERSTELHTQQLGGVLQQTSDLETAIGSANERIKDLDAEVANLKSAVAKQDKTIASLKSMKEESLKDVKEEFKNAIKSVKKMQDASLEKAKEEFTQISSQALAEMKDLVEIQKEQVETFHDQASSIKREVITEVEGKVSKVADEVKYNSLKSQAFRNKQNLVVTGLKENPDSTPLALAEDFFTSKLKIKDLELNTAYRLGAAPAPDSSYARPLVVKFDSIAHRDKVWKNKVDITEEDGHRIRVHADLPKRLRDDAILLRRVQKAASGYAKFRSAKVRDYKLLLDGEEYAPNELERLPKPIRPSTLATPRSDTVVAFFSRHSAFSNHYLSPFTVKGVNFCNMEQYLAYRKALFTDNDRLASEALGSRDPAEAKSILNRLKKNCPPQWYDQVPKILAEGLREKFKQNQFLLEILISTRGLEIGEASLDNTWGIGMTLNDPHVLDRAKWLPNGNLLGRTLMEIREEIRAQASVHASPAKPKKSLTKK